MTVPTMLERRTAADDIRLIYERDPRVRTIADALRAAADFPVEPGNTHGIVFSDSQGNEQRLTYSALWQAARTTAHGLRARGVQQGDRVLLLLPTSQEYVITLFAAIIIGAIPSTVATPTTRAQAEDALRYLVHIQNKLEPALLVVQPNLRGMVADHPAFDSARVVTADDLQHEGPLAVEALPILTDTDPLHIQLTSGSTNRPKGVLLSHKAVIANIQAITRGMDFVPGIELPLSWLPLYHDMGFIQLLTVLYYQTTIVLMTPTSFLRNPLSWLQNIGRFRISVTAAPTFAYSLCTRKFDPERLRGLDLSSWRRSFVGAEAVPPQVLQEFTRRFQPYGLSDDTLYPCYGMAETVLATTLPLAVRHPNRRFGFVSIDCVDANTLRRDGRAIPSHDTSADTLEIVGTGHAVQGLDICVRAATGQTMADREVGEICVRGTSLMEGYFRDQDATAGAVRDGWYHTGDLGYLVDGELYVLGRIKELVIVRGRNYQPDDIEEVIEQTEGVRQGYTVAFGINNIERGTDDVVAIAETKAAPGDRAVIAQQIQQSLQRAFGFLADVLLFVPHGTLPRTTSGKRQRVLAQEWYRAGKFEG